MIRGLLLSFPVLLLVALDGALAWAGKAAGAAPPTYNPVVREVLGMSLQGFAGALGAWYLCLLLFCWVLPALLSEWLYASAALLHFWSVLMLVHQAGRPGVHRAARWIGGPVGDAVGSAGPMALTAALILGTALVGVVCLRGAGFVAPAAKGKKAKPGKKDGKGKGGEDDG